VTLSRSLLLGGWHVADAAVQQCAQASLDDIHNAIDSFLTKDALLAWNTEPQETLPMQSHRTPENLPVDESSQRKRTRSANRRSQHTICHPHAALISMAASHPTVGLSAAAIIFNVGSSCEPLEANGISIVVAEAVAQRIRRKILPMPAAIEAVASRDATAILIEGPTHAMPGLIRSSIAGLRSHHLKESEFESSRRRILSINQLLPMNREKHIVALALQQLYKGTSYCKPATGTIETVGSLRYASFSDWIRRMAESTVVVSVVGEDSAECVEYLRSSFGRERCHAFLRASNESYAFKSVTPVPILQTSE